MRRGFALHTFRVVFHCILKVFHDSLLANHLLNLSLIINIEWVVVEPLNLPLPLYSLSSLLILAVAEDLCEPRGIVNGTS